MLLESGQVNDPVVTTLEGQVIVGACWSTTVTVKVQLFVLPEVSVAVQVTVVVPFGNVEPDGGLHTVEATAQLSVAIGA